MPKSAAMQAPDPDDGSESSNPDDALAVNDGNNARASWNFSGDHVNRNLSHYDARSREALKWLFHYCVQEHISRQEMATQLKVNDTTLSKLFRRKYVRAGTGELLPPPKGLIPAIEKLRSLVMKRSMYGKTEFVMTPTANKIFQICDMAMTSNTIAFIWSKSHIGKTWALREYARQNNHGSTKYLSLPTATGKHEVIRMFAEACAVSSQSCYDKLKTRVLNAIDENNLVIVDEFHMLSYTYQHRAKLGVAELIREIHDRTNCGMVISGTHIFRDEIEIGKDKSAFEQLSRRGVFQLELGDEASKGDLTAIFKAHGLAYPTGEDAHVIRGISQNKGLEAISQMLRLGNKLANNKQERLNWAHVIDAWKRVQEMNQKPKFG